MDKIRTRKRLVYPENVSQEELKQSCHVSTSSTWMQETSLSSSSSASTGQIPEEDDCDQNERCVLPGEVPDCDTVDNRCNQVTEQLANRCGSNDSNQDSSHNDEHTDSARLDSEGGRLVQQRIRSLARAFTERALKVRRRFDFPPTPSTISSDPDDGSSLYPSPMRKKDKIVRWVSQEWGSTLSTCGSMKTKIRNFDTLIHPEGYLYVTWLCIVTMAYVYNCCVIPLRTVFPYQTPENVLTWHCLDYSMDAIYIIDTILVKPRIMYLDDGFWIRNARLTRQNYFRKTQFKTDVLSLVPLDLVYFKTGDVHPLLRLPRMLKLQTFWEFFNHFDKVLPTPYAVRVARSLTYMIYLVHLNACAYYAVSVKEGLGSNSWVFDGHGNAYIRCFYFATKTATSIGKNPRPENELEYLFMTACWLMGVFVFALLIGQIRDIIATATRAQTDYRKRMDETLDYLRVLNLPPKLLDRVKTWFTFTWEQQHTLDERHILDSLPHKMKTDVAINVHINTLNKVQLFKNCDEALLRELVLKLRPVIYLPGDYICRKGEVGKEMYIVKTGKVQVVSGEDGTEVLATLTEGSVFGEISLLSLTGGNRRTADVRSYGFSNLFVLSKDDLNEALIFYPNAQEILKKKAKQLMHQNAAREQRCNAEVVIGNSEPPARLPRLLPIVMKVVPPHSKTARFLKYGSRYSARACTYGRNDSVRFHLAKKVTRCHSVDLGNIHADYDEKFWMEHQKNICNTFQGHVTVHREMSK